MSRTISTQCHEYKVHNTYAWQSLQVDGSQVHEGNKRVQDANKCTKATNTLRELRNANLQVDEAQHALVPYNYFMNKILAN
jgi:hypothetical protein